MSFDDRLNKINMVYGLNILDNHRMTKENIQKQKAEIKILMKEKIDNCIDNCKVYEGVNRRYIDGYKATKKELYKEFGIKEK